MANYQMSPRDLLVGAAIGGVLGTTSALLMAPKSGRRFRQDICDACEDVSDKTQDVAYDMKKKGKAWMNSFSSQSDWGDTANDVIENIKEWVGTTDEEMPKDLLVGGLAGAIVGAVIGLLAAPKSGTRFRQDLADKYEEMSEKAQDAAELLAKRGKTAARNVQSSAEDWLELAQQVLEQIKSGAEDVTANGKGKRKGSNRLNSAMDWASLGFRLWQSMKKGR